MNEYSFIDVSYEYINSQQLPNGRYPNVIEYIKDIVVNQIKGAVNLHLEWSRGSDSRLCKFGT